MEYKVLRETINELAGVAVDFETAIGNISVLFLGAHKAHVTAGEAGERNEPWSFVTFRGIKYTGYVDLYAPEWTPAGAARAEDWARHAPSVAGGHWEVRDTRAEPARGRRDAIDATIGDIVADYAGANPNVLRLAARVQAKHRRARAQKKADEIAGELAKVNDEIAGYDGVIGATEDVEDMDLTRE